MNTINQVKAFDSVENAVGEMMGIIKNLFNFNYDDERFKIPRFSKKITPTFNEFNMQGRNDENILKLHVGFTKALLETSTLKVHYGYNYKVELSEYTQGAADPFRVTQYTAKGKQIIESGQPKSLMPIANGEGDIVVDKILDNMFKDMLAYSSLNDKSLDIFVSLFEKGVRTRVAMKREQRENRNARQSSIFFRL